MKKILSLLVAALILFSSLSTLAADKEARQPDVFVNDALVEFADQSAYITDEGRTLVPARGVFEALGCEVGWDAENYVVTVAKDEEKKEIVLKIDDAEMKIVTDGNEEVRTLEVPAQLMNNRTMIPLRAVSEALGCAIIWNEAEYSIRISEMRQISNEEFNEKLQMLFNASQNKEKEEENANEEENKVVLSLVSDTDDISEGEEFEVYICIDNISDKYSMTDALIELNYDKNKFEYIPESASLLNNEGAPDTDDELMENIKHESGVRFDVANLSGTPILKDGKFAVVKFKALTSDGGEIKLVSNKMSAGGYTTSLVVSDYSVDPIEDVGYNGSLVNLENAHLELK